MYVNCVGMIQSGSTLQCNIAAELLELKGLGRGIGDDETFQFDRVKKQDNPEQYNLFKSLLLTDEIEDELKQSGVASILYVYRDIRDVCVLLMEQEHRTFEEVFHSNVLQSAIEAFDRVRKSPVSKYVQSYEVMVLNLKREIINVADFFGVELTRIEVDALYEKIMLHVDDDEEGGIERYKTVLNQGQIKKLENTFQGWLLENSYALTSFQPGHTDEPYRKYYSQHGEDYLLWNFFKYKKNGFFVEVGAFDGIHLSNTYSFELSGWKGICIEPSEFFKSCEKNRRNSICLNVACVGDESIEEMSFFQEELGLLSSLNMDNEKIADIESRYGSRKLKFDGVREYKVKCMTLDRILSENSVDSIDFLSVDVEGSEVEVLKGIDLGKYAPSVIVVEANDEQHKQELIEYLTVENRYIFARQVDVNLMFVTTDKAFFNLRNIDINCTIEKQLHPLGEQYTLRDFLYGVQWLRGKNSLVELQRLGNALNAKSDECKKIEKECIQQKNEITSEYKTQLLEKARELAEKGAALAKAQNVIAEWETLIARQNEAAAAQGERLSKAERELSERGEALASAQNAIAEQEALIRRQNETAAVQNEKLSKAERELSERGEALANAQSVIAEQEALIARQNEAAVIQGERLSKIERELSERGEALTSAQNAIAEQEALIQRQNETAAVQNEKLSVRERELSERGEALASAQNAMAEQDERLAAMECKLAEKMETLKNANTKIEEQSNVISEMRSRLDHMFSSIEAICEARTLHNPLKKLKAYKQMLKVFHRLKGKK